MLSPGPYDVCTRHNVDMSPSHHPLAAPINTPLAHVKTTTSGRACAELWTRQHAVFYAVLIRCPATRSKASRNRIDALAYDCKVMMM
eukprot:m.34103 g.34103  ORF g.34103 m.34103 type:complete len:87 (-) comp5101_c0_seq2:729-989(-)